MLPLALVSLLIGRPTITFRDQRLPGGQGDENYARLLEFTMFVMNAVSWLKT